MNNGDELILLSRENVVADLDHQVLKQERIGMALRVAGDPPQLEMEKAFVR